jgi:hypothetical protein
LRAIEADDDINTMEASLAEAGVSIPDEDNNDRVLYP